MAERVHLYSVLCTHQEENPILSSNLYLIAEKKL